MMKKFLFVVVTLLIGGVIVLGPMHFNKSETESTKQVANLSDKSKIKETPEKKAVPVATAAAPNEKSQPSTSETSIQKDIPISSEGKMNLSSTPTSTAKTTTANTAFPIWKNMGLGHVVKINANSVMINEIMAGEGNILFTNSVPELPDGIEVGDPVKFYFTIMSDDTLLMDSIQKVTKEELDPDHYPPISEQTVSISFVGMEGQLFVVSDGMKEYTLNPNENNKRILQNAHKGDKLTGILYTYTDGYQIIDLK